MALVGKTVSVNDSTPTLLVDGTEIDGDYVVHVQTAFDTLVGGDDVSTSNGFGLNTAGDNVYSLQQGEKLYAVATSGSHYIGILLYNQ